jgi:hypothetical protein
VILRANTDRIAILAAVAALAAVATTAAMFLAVMFGDDRVAGLLGAPMSWLHDPDRPEWSTRSSTG